MIKLLNKRAITINCIKLSHSVDQKSIITETIICDRQ